MQTDIKLSSQFFSSSSSVAHRFQSDVQQTHMLMLNNCGEAPAVWPCSTLNCVGGENGWAFKIFSFGCVKWQQQSWCVRIECVYCMHIKSVLMPTTILWSAAINCCVCLASAIKLKSISSTRQHFARCIKSWRKSIHQHKQYIIIWLFSLRTGFIDENTLAWWWLVLGYAPSAHWYRHGADAGDASGWTNPLVRVQYCAINSVSIFMCSGRTALIDATIQLNWRRIFRICRHIAERISLYHGVCGAVHIDRCLLCPYFLHRAKDGDANARERHIDVPCIVANAFVVAQQLTRNTQRAVDQQQ